MAQTFGFVLYVLGLEACVLGLGLGLGLVAYVLGLAICVLDSITAIRHKTHMPTITLTKIPRVSLKFPEFSRFSRVVSTLP